MSTSEDKSFDNLIPLPFRVSLFIAVGVYLWWLLVYFCHHYLQINCLALLNLSYSPHKYSADETEVHVIDGSMATVASADFQENSRLIQGIGATARTVTISNACGLVGYWTACYFGGGTSIIHYSRTLLPLIIISTNLYVVFFKRGSVAQDRVNVTFKRILLGKINSATMRSNDILLSDSLMSYSKIINDFCGFLWVYIVSSSYNRTVEAMVLSYPSLLRIKQCWFEFRTTNQRQHLFNLLKYSTLLGPIVVNLYIKSKMAQNVNSNALIDDLKVLDKWWYIVSFVNSLYLFVWDIRMDWGFEAFDFLFSGKYNRYTLLRDKNKLVCTSMSWYYFVVVADFVLRFIWILKAFVMLETEMDLRFASKVGNFLFGYDSMSLGFATLEALEIFRRWLWCFVKLENDLVKLQLRDEFARAIPFSNLKAI